MERHMQHIESMGDKWFALGVALKDINGVIATTLELGGTRPAWSMRDVRVQTLPWR